MLSTPISRDWKGVPGDGFNVKSLPRDVSLLPTPMTNDHGSNSPGDNNRKSPGLRTIPNMTKRGFGEFQSAIDRWEKMLGRNAPDPVEPNTKGTPQLSSSFVEWMMGLPEGWVTDIDISRTNQIKALGDGVVPQQGGAALKLLREELENGL